MNNKKTILAVCAVVLIIVITLVKQNYNFIKPLADTKEENEISIGQPYRIVWTEDVTDPKTNEKIPTLQIDENFISKAPENVKALLALYGYGYSNECDWEGNPNQDRSNLKCRLTTALNLGYQCSDKQITLLQKYFHNEMISKNSCPTTPNTATIQNILKEIILTQTSKNIFKIQFKVLPFNAREMVGTSESKIKNVPLIEGVDNFEFTVDGFVRAKY